MQLSLSTHYGSKITSLNLKRFVNFKKDLEIFCFCQSAGRGIKLHSVTALVNYVVT